VGEVVLVFAAGAEAVAVDSRPDVEAAVWLPERPDVGGEPSFGEEVVELEQVVVARAEGDLLRVISSASVWSR
jgi:hypothetical protein